MAGGNPFIGGKGLFTAHDPWSALRANPPPTWIAVMPQYMTPEFKAELDKRGIALVIWEPEASQAGVDAVNQYGAAGYIAQAEGQGQLDAALAVGSQITVPKALVTNNFMQSWPPGWIAMPEAYQNNNPQATPDQVTRDAQSRGATEVVPVVGVGFVDDGGQRQMSSAEYGPGLQNAGAAGAVGSAAYIAEQMSDEDLNAYTGGQTPTPAQPKTPTGQQPPPGGQTPPTTPTPSQQPSTPPPPSQAPTTPPPAPTQVPPPPGVPQGGIRPGAQAPLVEDIPDPEYATAGWGVHPPKPPFRPEGGPGGAGGVQPPSPHAPPQTPNLTNVPAPQQVGPHLDPNVILNALQPFVNVPNQLIPTPADWWRRFVE